MNPLVHPVVFGSLCKMDFNTVSALCDYGGGNFFESGALVVVDKIATVVALVEQRVKGLYSGIGLQEQVMERMRNQMDDEERIRKSDL